MMKKASFFGLLMLLVIGCLSAHGAATKIEASIDSCKSILGPVLTGEYEVVITFSGITLFERRDANGVINVRLANAVTGRPENPNTNPKIEKIPKHTAYILADIVTAKPLIDGGEGLHPAFFEGGCYNYFPLSGQVITVDNGSAPSANNGTLCITEAKENNKYCPNADPSAGVVTIGSMRWLPSIKTVLGGGGQTKHAPHFEDEPDSSVLSGMVVVDRGYLETVVTNPVVWGFKKKITDADFEPQAIAQEVRWHMRGKGSEFILKLKKKGGGEKLLKFTPVNGKVSIFIANNPSNETGPIHKASSMKMDHHFPLYYEFIDKFDVNKTVIPFVSGDVDCGNLTGQKPALVPCVCSCPKDPECPIVVTGGQPLPSGLNCGATQWP